MDYVLCASPRTGSNLLKSGLHRSGIGGTPEEVFGAELLERRGFPSEPPIDVAAYLARVRAERTSPNGVFGIKLHFDHAEAHLFAQGLAIESLLQRPRFVNISRDDRIGQAISWERALQTGHYTSVQASADHSGGAAPEPQYDFLRLSLTLLEVMRQQHGWETYFAERGIEPLRIRYEEFVARYDQTLVRVLEHLEVSLPEGFEVPPPSLSKQADVTSDAWRRRYFEDLFAVLERRIAAPTVELAERCWRLGVAVTELLIGHAARTADERAVAELTPRLERALASGTGDTAELEPTPPACGAAPPPRSAGGSQS